MERQEFLAENIELQTKVQNLERELLRHKIIGQNLRNELSEQKTIVQNLKRELSEYKVIAESLRSELSEFKRIAFGSASEKRRSTPDTQQLELFEQKYQEASTETEQEEQIEVKSYKKKKTQKRKKSCGRHSFPANLRREIEELFPEGYDPETMRIIGKDETEILAYKKPEIFVKKQVRPKVVSIKDEDQGVKQAPIPPRLIPKGMVDESLIAEMVTEKILYHTPVYRFKKKLKHVGVNVSNNVLLNWFHAAAENLKPLYHLMHQDLLSQPYIQVDESTIKVLPKNNKNACKIGYMWVLNVPKLKAALFHYGAGRSQKEGHKLIGDYNGIVQADGYEVYQGLKEKNNYTLIYCMAHARRKFYQALGTDPPRAEFFLDKVDQLYDIERRAREENYLTEQRLLLRRKEAIPILAELENWLKEQVEQPSTVLKTPIEKAIKYSHSRWKGLMAYAYDGRLEIDNNLIENSIRPLALGRKNYLFAANNYTAQNLAILYSLVITAEKNKLDVYKYLLWIFDKIVHNKVTDAAINWLPYNLDKDTIENLPLNQ